MWSQRGASLPGVWLVALRCYTPYFSTVTGTLRMPSSNTRYVAFFSDRAAQCSQSWWHMLLLMLHYLSLSGAEEMACGWRLKCNMIRVFFFLCKRACIFNETMVHETANCVISWAVLKYWHQWLCVFIIIDMQWHAFNHSRIQIINFFHKCSECKCTLVSSTAYAVYLTRS